MIHEIAMLLEMLLKAGLSLLAISLIFLLILLVIFTPIFFVGAFFSEEPYWRAIVTGYSNLLAAWRRLF